MYVFVAIIIHAEHVLVHGFMENTVMQRYKSVWPTIKLANTF